jgi:hypothetical protein
MLKDDNCDPNLRLVELVHWKLRETFLEHLINHQQKTPLLFHHQLTFFHTIAAAGAH